jgi:addiction module RelE/StbE family toxin
MTIHWTARARRQFLAILDHLLAENPAAAEGVYDAITTAVARLAEFPEMGRRGRLGGTRELVIPSQPYLVAYRIQRRAIQILAVLHGAQKWPEQL